MERRGNQLSFKIEARNIRAHRAAWAIMTGEWPPPHSIKFLDGNPYNLAWSNLVAMPEGERRCTVCLRFLPESKFGKSAQPRPRCLECRRNKHIEQYGITTEDYQSLLTAQKGVCAICKKPPGKYRLSVDHCHTKGNVRGLLCTQCNTALGLLRDCPDNLDAAKAYLKNTKS